ncbi:SPOR domain-containing protein [Deltaproteobacteria bacterium OttesenSCG-928-K17]|nr:SPOR domain-containing protein [Deltaproteobacteria bacterium OttesenSCG-928-K17]
MTEQKKTKGTAKAKKAASTPKKAAGSEEAKCLSRRDQHLALVEKLLAEQHLQLEPECAEPETPLECEPVDLDDAVEIAKLPPPPAPEPEPKAAEAEKAEKPAAEDKTGEAPTQIDGAAESPGAAKKTAQQAVIPPPPKKSGAGRTIALGLLILALLALFFVTGLMAGRGHIMKGEPLGKATAWLEQNLGFVAAPARPVEKTPAEETAKPGEGEATETASDNSGEQPGEAAAPDEAAADKPAEDLPAWDWNAWPAPDDENENSGQAAESAGEAAAGSAADSNAEESPAAGSATVGGAEESPAAGDATVSGAEESPAAGDATVSDAEENPAAGDAAEEETQWPTAIEDDAAAAPADGSSANAAGSEAVDYESMLEPAEVPDATYAEGASLPPANGMPGTGKYAVLVALAFNEKDADTRIKRLAEQGFSAYSYATPNGRYSVRVGRFDTRQAADSAKVRLEEMGYESPTVSMLSDVK